MGLKKQYTYRCCGNIVWEYSSEKTCRFCGEPSPILEEVDKDDRVFIMGGFSGDKKHEVRSWGEFSVLLDEQNVKVKKITVYPKQRLSLQLHRHRNEWWKIITGEGVMQIGSHIYPVKTGDTVTIDKLQVHRITNESDKNLVFVEVQTGVCQESDIFRIEDDYGRV